MMEEVVVVVVGLTGGGLSGSSRLVPSPGPHVGHRSLVAGHRSLDCGNLVVCHRNRGLFCHVACHRNRGPFFLSLRPMTSDRRLDRHGRSRVVIVCAGFPLGRPHVLFALCGGGLHLHHRRRETGSGQVPALRLLHRCVCSWCLVLWRPGRAFSGSPRTDWTQSSAGNRRRSQPAAR